MSFRSIIAVARREYVETVKTRAFIIGILLMPALIIGMVYISVKTGSDKPAPSRPVHAAVVDHTHRIAAQMDALANRTGDRQKVELEVIEPANDPGTQLEQLKQQLRDEKISCIIQVPADAITKDSPCVLYLKGSLGDGRLWAVRNLISDAVELARFADAGIDANRVRDLRRPVGISQENVDDHKAPPSRTFANTITPFAFVFLMFMGVIAVSQGLLTSVIEEKSSRVAEVLLSALSPFELMVGKIFGMAGVGLTMVVLWAGVGYAAAVWQHQAHLIQLSYVGQFIVYYLLGFLLISSMLAAVGSACNTLKDAQTLMGPVTMVVVLPMVFWMQVAREPNSALATALSFIPPLTPLVMIVRLVSINGPVPLWQQLVAPIWLAIWVVLTMWAASRAFRVGLLMYGKTPSLREMARWITYR